jgi:crotonobetainyl-CoA:carnitine CoA-transferase CaiB-like acyl-CoA transferase
VALEGLRVIEAGGEIAAAYCTKLLADLGAEVLKIEPPEGDRLRQWGPFPANAADPEKSGLFRYLNTNKASTVADLDDGDGQSRLLELMAGADLLVESLGAGVLERRGLDLSRLESVHPTLAMVRISAYGQAGPYRDRPASDLTLQASGGWVSVHGVPGRNPVQVGGRLPEYLAGTFAATAGLTAVLAARRRSRAVVADLSVHECLVATLPYPMLFLETLRELGMPPPEERFSTLPGIVRCRDGWVGINALTAQHWHDICVMAGADEFADRQIDLALGGPELDRFYAKIQPWLDEHTVDEIVELSQAFRAPAAPVGTGESLPRFAQFAERPFFINDPELGFLVPGFPYRLSLTPPTVRYAAPALGSSSGWATPRAGNATSADPPADLPFAGMRVLDLGTFWAGPYAGCFLGAFGADVIKVESVQRADGFRFVAIFPQAGEDWYERGGLFQGTNLNKRAITLDLSRTEGADLFRRLVATADVVIENFSARVMDHFGLGYEELRAIKPDIVMVRMPAFGLSGPWRDYVGWAMGIEQAAGMAWITGVPDGPPLNPGGFADPVVAMHAVVAVLAALEHRRATGEGQLVEMAQIEMAAALTAEQTIAYDLNREVQTRGGNRSRVSAPQGVYPTADGSWVAVTVRDDRDWMMLCQVIGAGALADDGELATLEGRRRRHDELDERLAEWTRGRTAAETVAALQAVGVPASGLLVPAGMYGEPQLEARGFYQALHHPRSGIKRYPGWPVRFSFRDEPHRMVAPTLGQHNEEVLSGELGLEAGEIEQLAAARVIGTAL